MKVSLDKTKNLLKESKFLKKLSGVLGVPTFIDSGADGNYIVMQLLGKNLCSEIKKLNHGLSLDCIVKIAYQGILIFESIHSNGIVHRDVKPEQFLTTDTEDQIYLVDYGLSTKYLKRKSHKAFKKHSKAVGSVIFTSVYSHMGFTLSRRDDLESFLYTIYFLARKELPWDENLSGLKTLEKWEKVLKKKISYVEKLFFKWPIEFLSIFSYIKNLEYEEAPNYCYILLELSNLKDRIKLSNTFDWNLQDKSIIELMVNDFYMQNPIKKKRKSSINERKRKKDSSKKRIQKAVDNIKRQSKTVEYTEEIKSMAAVSKTFDYNIYSDSQVTERAPLPEINRSVLSRFNHKVLNIDT